MLKKEYLWVRVLLDQAMLAQKIDIQKERA